MKKKLYILLLLFPLWGLGGLSCDSDDNNCVGIDCLPPATTTGEGTFGCLVNGEPFVDNSGAFNCFYQVVDGEYYFGITATVDRSDYVQIDIGSLKKEILTNTILELKEREVGNFYAWLSFDCICPQGKTNSVLPGSLIITKLDSLNNIVSGTFEFTVKDPNTGTVYEITEGRFDSLFTQ
jgi:hypothetical protein